MNILGVLGNVVDAELSRGGGKARAEAEGWWSEERRERHPERDVES